jgi:hypothetical protein
MKAQYVRNGLFAAECSAEAEAKSSTFRSGGFKRLEVPIRGANASTPPAHKKYDKAGSFMNRLRAGICELCGKHAEGLALHQV